MNKGTFQKILPHLIAVAVFLIVAVIYCRPALEGKVVSQDDIIQWKGAFHQSEVYKERHGEYPLWTNALFSGMPTFQIGGLQGSFITGWLHTLFTLGLPKPISFFFLACICFYFLCCIVRIRPYIGIFGALAFAYATYNPVIINVGHDTKMWSIAYMPALLGCILMIYERRQYWLGAALTGLVTSVMIAVNHPQIDYYFSITAAILTIFFVVRWIKAKEFTHLTKALSFTLIAGFIGLMVNAVNFLSTYEYQKETIRGGASKLDTTANGSRTGLDKSYAFSYSMAITEPLVMMVPGFYGNASMPVEMFKEDSKALEALQSMPQEVARQLGSLRIAYWGGMTLPGEVGVSGPVYVGAIICILAIIGMFILDNKHKWWILTAVAFTIMMSWGHYFDTFNSLLYNYFPLYNKFRAPSMAMVIPQLLLPFLAVLTVQKVASLENKQNFFPYFKKSIIGIAGVFALLFIIYLSSDFLSRNDKEILQQVNSSNQPQLTSAVQTFYEGLKEDRRSLMLGDIFRAFGYALAALGVLFLLIRKMINPVVGGVLLSFLVLVDLLPVASNYLNAESYVEPEENQSFFQKTAADEAILSDKSYYRVFNVAGNAFSENITSYWYNSVGGYHPAKIRIYQDLIEKQLSKQQLNFPVLNMLNTKYLIQRNQQGLTENYQKNDSALGPVWFVKGISVVRGPKEEMAALDYFSPRDTAIIQEAFTKSLNNQVSWNAEGTIELMKNDNDVIDYRSNSNSNQLAVFSEVFYNAGWKAYIDNKEVPILKVNYVLRALPIPAGTHQIQFRFEPPAYLLGRKLTNIFTILVLLLLAAAIFFEWRRNKGAAASAS
ncbi:MAG TPA: YfhO family protein [Flavisolibacter sp.]|nr:YfhO family protein [Flavisolibacter sp.]